MSSPPNILSSYRTYSYHQFLVLCSDSMTAGNIGVVKSDLTALRHPPGDRYGIRNSSSGGQYITLVDGTSDSHLHITKANWKTVVTPNKETDDKSFKGFGPQVDGIIEIYEPSGAAFLGILADAAARMGISQSVLQFALKTVFVGETHDSTVEYIHGVKPFVFNAYDVSAVFDSTGSKYRIAAIGSVGGDLKRNQAIISGNGMFIEADTSLPEAMKKLSGLIDTAVQNGVDEFKQSETNTGGTPAEVKEVEYQIHLDSAWDGDKIVMGKNENYRIHNSSGNPVLMLAQGSASTVKKAIERILVSSSDIMELQKSENPGQPIEKRSVFSITDSVEVTNEGKQIYHYYIGKKEVLTSPIGQDTSTQDVNLELDYIFTGQNIDIIDFNMKLINGLNLISTLKTVPSVTNNINDRTGSVSDVVIGDPGVQSASGKTVVPSQLEIGANFEQSSYSNTNYPVATTNFYTALSAQAKVDTVGVVISIHGNPNLLNDFTVNQIDFDDNGLIANTNASDNQITADFINSPTTMRINVMFPANPDDPTAGYVPFWYQGIYRMLIVEHKFSDGKFRQEITLTSLPGSHPGYDGGEVSGGTPDQAVSASGVNESDERVSTASAEDPMTLEEVPNASLTELQDEYARLQDIRYENEANGCNIFQDRFGPNANPDYPYACWGSEMNELVAIEIFKRLAVPPGESYDPEPNLADADKVPVSTIKKQRLQQ